MYNKETKDNKMTYSAQTQNKINTLENFIEYTRIKISEMNMKNVNKSSDDYVNATEFQADCARKLVKIVGCHK